MREREGSRMKGKKEKKEKIIIKKCSKTCEYNTIIIS